MTMAAGARWEHFPHGADIGIRGLGPTLDAAFEQVALALTAVMTEPARVEARETIEVSCTASNPDDLLYDWIDAIVFEMATRGMLFGAYDVRIEGNRLASRLRGERVDRARHEPAVEVKGPTYTQLHVSHDEARDEWVAQCVVDV
ncbi:MAG TPA: archease [Candidatus Krumholzibacteria bacterium]|nr:archease [Candidatus Krumholzibacteria bacterium]